MLFKIGGIAVSAEKTGPVAGAEGGGFIKEEKFSPGIGAHHLSSFAFVFKHTGDPCFQFKIMPDLFFMVVQDSPVAGPRPAGRRSDNITPGVYSVLKHSMCMKDKYTESPAGPGNKNLTARFYYVV